MSGFPQVPRSACAGVVWPAFADDASAQMLALQYQLEQSQWWPEERLRALQMAQFGQVFRHAVATVPYYGERFAPWSRGGMDWDRFHELPVSTRREIQLAGDAMHSTAVPQAHGPGVTTQSSGSTGSPLVTRGTAWTQLMWQALLLRDHLWHGRDLGGKLAAIRSKIEVARLDGWGPATAAFATGPSVMLNFAIDIDEQLRWLQAEEPDYLLTHGTNLHALAQRGIELDVRLPRLKQARTYSETLRPDTRDLVRAAWGVEIADSYSSEELGYIALQCPLYECYHVQAESLIVEVLDETGRPCAPGAIGQVVVSTLHNFAMPLLRYASGDYAEAGEPCACGRGLPVLKRIVGRQRNMLRRPDGTSHWPSFPMEVWRGAASVLQIQLVQDAIDHVEVRAVMSRDFAGDEHAHFVEALQGCLGYPFRITVKRVGEIPRGAGLKYEDFVSLLD